MNISGPAAVAKPEMLFYAPGDLTVTFMFVQALFLYIEKRIIRIIGNPVMDDNCKMVAKFRAITL